ncbi:DNA polymerase [Buchnera aphidicola]|uniref:DNA polymerase n=1 Tax=Buchnera aphidicola TaxID=9 RepID=UPI00346488DC
MVNNKKIKLCPHVIPNIEYILILKKEKFEKMLKKIEKFNFFSFIIQTKLFNINHAYITGFSFSITINQIFYIPIINNDFFSLKIHDQYDILVQLKILFENKNILKIGYNIKKNYHFFKKYNITLSGNKFDTMIASHMLKNIYKNKEILEDLEKTWIEKNEINKNNIDIKKYIDLKSHINLKLYEEILVYLEKEKKIKKILENIEIPLIEIIANIERNGVLINIKKLKKQSKEINIKLSNLQQDAYQLTGLSFNILSSTQSRKMLLQIKENKNNIKSNIQKKDILLNIIKNYRSLYKLKSTYLDQLPKKINKKTGKIHTCYYQTNTLTGRLSSKNPNLQNIPSKTKEGYNIRKAFIAKQNFFIVSADYSQIELRILAHLSQDKKLIKIFLNNYDLHKITASEIFNVPIANITNEQRQLAKIINFSLIYGISPFSLSNRLKINILQAKEYIKTYFQRYKDVRKYLQNTYQFALEKGYVLTFYGRKIFIPNINSKNFLIRKSAERTAINAPIQGTVSDIIKLAMIKIYNCFKKKYHLDAKMIMQVHDELVFEIKKEKIKNICKDIRHIMEYNTKLDVPICINIKIGNNWNENIKHIQ